LRRSGGGNFGPSYAFGYGRVLKFGGDKGGEGSDHGGSGWLGSGWSWDGLGKGRRFGDRAPNKFGGRVNGFDKGKNPSGERPTIDGDEGHESASDSREESERIFDNADQRQAKNEEGDNYTSSKL
jgi:hypothetical protein